MLTDILLVVVTALLSSACTLGAAWWLWERRLRSRLDHRIAELRGEVNEELGETIRRQVRQGILDGVAAIPSGELLRNTQRGLTDTAAELVRGGLSSILGTGRRPPPRPPVGDVDEADDGEEGDR